MTSNEPRTQVTEPREDAEFGGAAGTAEEEPVTAEALIEEVSIDGMCGVY